MRHEIISLLIRSGLKVAILGPSGTGKTAFIESMCGTPEFRSRDNICQLNAGNIDPSEAAPISLKTEDNVLDKPLKLARNEFHKIAEAWSKNKNDRFIIFIDEITNAGWDLLTTLMSAISTNQIAGFSFDDRVTIVLAGNSTEHSELAQALPSQFSDRFIILKWNYSAEENNDYQANRIINLLKEIDPNLSPEDLIYSLRSIDIFKKIEIKEIINALDRCKDKKGGWLHLPVPHRDSILAEKRTIANTLLYIINNTNDQTGEDADKTNNNQVDIPSERTLSLLCNAIATVFATLSDERWREFYKLYPGYHITAVKEIVEGCRISGPLADRINDEVNRFSKISYNNLASLIKYNKYIDLELFDNNPFYSNILFERLVHLSAYPDIYVSGSDMSEEDFISNTFYLIDKIFKSRRDENLLIIFRNLISEDIYNLVNLSNVIRLMIQDLSNNSNEKYLDKIFYFLKDEQKSNLIKLFQNQLETIYTFTILFNVINSMFYLEKNLSKDNLNNDIIKNAIDIFPLNRSNENLRTWASESRKNFNKYQNSIHPYFFIKLGEFIEKNRLTEAFGGYRSDGGNDIKMAVYACLVDYDDYRKILKIRNSIKSGRNFTSIHSNKDIETMDDISKLWAQRKFDEMINLILRNNEDPVRRISSWLIKQKEALHENLLYRLGQFSYRKEMSYDR